MSKLTSRISLAVMILFGGLANADLLLEPFIGYQMGKVKLTDKSTGDADGGDVRGPVIGGRVGYMLPLLNFWGAADVSVMSSGKYEASDTTASDGDISTSNVYLDVGYDFPVLLRVWLGYGIANKSKIKYDTGGSTELSGGNHLKFGVGFTPLPLVSINLEMYQSDFEKYSDSSGNTGKTNDLWSTHKDSGFIVSASIPLTF